MLYPPISCHSRHRAVFQTLSQYRLYDISQSYLPLMLLFRFVSHRHCRPPAVAAPPLSCAKTTLVRAIARSASLAFLSLGAASVFAAHLGESERILRDAFHRARANRPCVLFLDEIDAITMKRGDAGGTSTGMRVYIEAFCQIFFETCVNGIRLPQIYVYSMQGLTHCLRSSFIHLFFSFVIFFCSFRPSTSPRFGFGSALSQRSRVASSPRC